MTMTLDFQGQFEKAVSQEWKGRLTWNKGMWVDRKSNHSVTLNVDLINDRHLGFFKVRLDKTVSQKSAGR